MTGEVFLLVSPNASGPLLSPIMITRIALCLIALLVFCSTSHGQAKNSPKEVYMPMKVLGNLLKFHAEENGNKYPDRVEALIEAELMAQPDIDRCKHLFYAGKGLAPEAIVRAEDRNQKKSILAIAMNSDKSHYTIVYVDANLSNHKNEKGFKSSEEVYKSYK